MSIEYPKETTWPAPVPTLPEDRQDAQEPQNPEYPEESGSADDELYNYLQSGEPEDYVQGGEPEEEEWEETPPDEGAWDGGDGAFFGGQGSGAAKECLDHKKLVEKLKDLVQKIDKGMVNKSQMREIWRELYRDARAKCDAAKSKGQSEETSFWCQVAMKMRSAKFSIDPGDGRGPDIAGAFRELLLDVKHAKPKMCP